MRPSSQPTRQPSGNPTAKPTSYNTVLGTGIGYNGKALTAVGGCDAVSMINCMASCSPIAPGFRVYSQSKMINYVFPNPPMTSVNPTAAPVSGPGPSAAGPSAAPTAKPSAAPSSGAPFIVITPPKPTAMPVPAAGSPTAAPTKAAISAVVVVQPITFGAAIPAAALVPGSGAYNNLKGSVQLTLYTSISAALNNPTGLNVTVNSITANNRRRRELLQTTSVNVNYKVAVNNPNVVATALSSAVTSPAVVTSAATGAAAATGVTATAATPTVTVLTSAPTFAPSSAPKSAAASVRASGAATLTVGLIVGFLLTMLA